MQSDSTFLLTTDRYTKIKSSRTKLGPNVSDIKNNNKTLMSIKTTFVGGNNFRFIKINHHQLGMSSSRMKVKVTDERNVSFYNNSLWMRSATKIYTGSKMPQKYAVEWQSAGTVQSGEKVKLVHRSPGEENRASRLVMA